MPPKATGGAEARLQHPEAPRHYLEQVAGQASLPCVHQQEVIVQGPGKTIRDWDLLHFHSEWQLGL